MKKTRQAKPTVNGDTITLPGSAAGLFVSVDWLANVLSDLPQETLDKISARIAENENSFRRPLNLSYEEFKRILDNLPDILSYEHGFFELRVASNYPVDFSSDAPSLRSIPISSVVFERCFVGRKLGWKLRTPLTIYVTQEEQQKNGIIPKVHY